MSAGSNWSGGSGASSNQDGIFPTPDKFISAQDLVSDDYTLAGFLRKRGTLNQLPGASKIFAWGQRFVVLHQGCLYCYKSETDRKPCSSLSLYGYNTVYKAGDVPSSEALWAFKITHTYPAYKTYYFSAACERDMKVWMEQIKLEMLRANNKKNKRMSADGVSDDGSDTGSMSYEDISKKIYEDVSKLVLDKTKPLPKKEDEESDDDYRDSETLPVPAPSFRPPVAKRPDRKKAHHKQHQNKTYNVNDALSEELAGKLNVKKKPIKPPSDTKPKIRERGDGNSGPKRGHRERAPTPPPEKATVGRESPTMPQDPAPAPPATEDYWSLIFYEERPEKTGVELIRHLAEDGVFLVRDSSTSVNEKVIVVFHDIPVKYKICQNEETGKFYINKEKTFVSIEELIYYYHENNLPGKEYKLTMAYFQHPKYDS